MSPFNWYQKECVHTNLFNRAHETKITKRVHQNNYKKQKQSQKGKEKTPLFRPTESVSYPVNTYVKHTPRKNNKKKRETVINSNIYFSKRKGG